MFSSGLQYSDEYDDDDDEINLINSDGLDVESSWTYCFFRFPKGLIMYL